MYLNSALLEGFAVLAGATTGGELHLAVAEEAGQGEENGGSCIVKACTCRDVPYNTYVCTELVVFNESCCRR